MDSMVYVLEIYYPDSRKDIWNTLESSAPFMAIGQGDIIDPSAWSPTQSPIRVLKVKEVHHTISEISGQTQHKVMLFTEEVMAFEAGAGE